jgi:hypothetical protein
VILSHSTTPFFKDGMLEIRLEKAPDVATSEHVTVEQWRISGG